MTNRAMPVLVGLAAAAAMVLAIGALYFIPQADIHRTNETRRDEQRSSCIQYNAQQRTVIAGDKAEIRILIRGLAPHPDPATLARIALFLPAYDHVVDATHPARDCSPEGIAKYLQQAP